MTEFPKRKNIRIAAYDYSTPGAYFVTVCTKNREKIFWHFVGADSIRPKKTELSAAGKIAEQGIRQVQEHYETVTVDKYCIMPDHIHLLLRITSDEGGRIISAPTIPTVVGSLKRWISRQVGRSIWQKSYYEHAVRNQQDYAEIWQYIENNPLKYQ